MAAKKPGRAESQEASETTEVPTADTGADGASAAIGGTGARAKGARKTASAGAGSGTTAGEGTGGSGAQSRTRPASKTAASDTGGQAAAGGTARAKKTTAKSATKSAAKRTGSTQGGGAQQAGGTQQGGGAQQTGADTGAELQGNLRAFLDHHPHGWGHNDWEGLLNHLRESGVDTSDTGRIGSELEKERVVRMLENSGVSGLAGNKVRSIADQFGNVYELRRASVEDIAGVKGITRSQAEQIHEAVR